VDVRSADASGLAAKRVEMDKIQPVKQKHHSAGEERFSTRTEEVSENSGRPKSEKHPRQRDEEEAGPQNGLDVVADDDAEPPPEPGEQHILDARA
jgi:hypothetical protein